MMKDPLETRLRRVRSVLAESGYQIRLMAEEKESVLVDILDGDEYHCTCLVETRSDFVEFFWPIEFSVELQNVVSELFMDFVGICHDHGVYFSMEADSGYLRINLCTKLFFSALHYYALNETLRDLFACVMEVESLFSPTDRSYRGVQHGNKEPDGRQGDTGSQ